MSLRPLTTALIMVLIAAPAHAELIIDRQDGQSPTVVSDAAIAQGLSSPAPSATPSNLHFSDANAYRSASSAPVIVPHASAWRAQAHLSQPQASPGSARVFETGSSRPSNADAPVKGWADNVPLELALQQVVPQGWSVSAAPAVKSQLHAQVSWSGDRPWVSVLSSMVSSLPVSARVDWDSRQVLLFDSATPIPSSLAVPGAHLVMGATPVAPVRHAYNQAPVVLKPASQVAIAETPCCAPVVTALPVVPAGQVWLIDPRLTLRENVEAWTKLAGWNSVVWEAADYPMVAPAKFEGQFASPEGPLARLIQAYAESDQPLKVRLLTQDKVVHVSNRNYMQTVVDPATPRSITPSTFSQ